MGVRTKLAGMLMAVIVAIGAMVSPTSAGATAAPSISNSSLIAELPSAAVRANNVMGNWTWYGYRLSREETNQIANVSLWNAISGVKGTRLIPYSSAIVGLYSVNWVLTARNARSMGRCLAVPWSGTGLIVGC